MTLGLLFGEAGWTALLLVFALLLDAAVGEPEAVYKRVPHPARLMGRAVAALDARLNNDADAPEARRRRGMAAIALLVAIALLIGLLLQAAPYLGPALSVLAGCALLSQRSLAEHVSAVADGLEQDLPAGRAAVSQIVGRDTEGLDGHGVARAAVESAAENFSDGVVAPAFWFLLLGLPGMLAYKIINTADSMIGHRTPRHEAFGWAAAKLDDLANLVPARLSALLLAVSSRRVGKSLSCAFADAGKHASPNAGWPEAAAAGALDLALAGPRQYEGRMTEDPFLNSAGRKLAEPRDVRQAVNLIGRAHLALIALLLGVVALTL